MLKAKMLCPDLLRSYPKSNYHIEITKYYSKIGLILQLIFAGQTPMR